VTKKARQTEERDISIGEAGDVLSVIYIDQTHRAVSGKAEKIQL
jgi:hypothetical protein